MLGIDLETSNQPVKTLVILGSKGETGTSASAPTSIVPPRSSSLGIVIVS